MALTTHLRRLLLEPVLDAELIYCRPIDSRGRDRASLARETQAAVAEAIAQRPQSALQRKRSLAA